MELTQAQRDELLKKFDKLSSGGERDYDFGFSGSWAGPNALRERNQKKLANWALNNPDTKKFREGLKKKTGIDVLKDTDKFPAMKEGFSWTKFHDKLREADSGSMYPLFLVAGVLQNVIGMYQVAKPSYMDWCTVTPTKLKATPVAPLHGISFPREVGEQMPYPVSQTAALSLQFVARKYGTMLEMTHELIEDDQTGQFKMLSGQLGEYLQLVTEVLCYGRFQSVNANQAYSGFAPGISETQPSGESNWPFATQASPFIGGGWNDAATKAAPTVANLELGMIQLRQQKNLLGVLMPVNPKRIIASPKYMFDLSVVLNSAFFPAVPSATAGATGANFGINPLKGIADLTISPFLFDNTGQAANTSLAWYLFDDSKPAFQLLMREPVSVTQETPTSGQSFERDVVRFKCSTRMIADWVDPRFAYRGSDGSA